jgi:murein DD-endopeptidase MepM/ murein hydrolase activator NlpD
MVKLSINQLFQKIHSFAKKINFPTLTKQSNISRKDIRGISNPDPNLKSSSVKPVIINKGSKEEIKNQLDQIFNNKEIDSSSIDFKVHPSVIHNFFQALEERSREKNPAYHKLVDKISSLEKDPNSAQELDELFKDPQSLLMKMMKAVNEHYGSITLISPEANLNSNESMLGLIRVIKRLDISIPDKQKNTSGEHVELHSFLRSLAVPSFIANTSQDLIQVENPFKIKGLFYNSHPSSHCPETGQEFAIDILSPNMEIGTPVYSATNGTVIKVEDKHPDREENMFEFSNENNPVNLLYVKSDDGLINFYAHLKQNSCLKLGERVKVGQKIAEVGNNGASTALHLHYAIGKEDESFPWGMQSLPVRFK